MALPILWPHIRNFQRMGLARALLLTGCMLLKERGMLSAHLGTSGDNIRDAKDSRVGRVYNRITKPSGFQRK